MVAVSVEVIGDSSRSLESEMLPRNWGCGRLVVMILNR